jgi:hypothetical protein
MIVIITRLFTILLIIPFCLKAQDKIDKSTSIGVNYSTTKSEALTYASLVGAGSFSGGRVDIYGISLLKRLSKRIDFEIGVEHASHDFVYEVSSFNSLTNSFDDISRDVSVRLWSVPILFRLNLWKYFFLQSGTTIDMDNSDESDLTNQSGLGFNLGLGVNYDFEFGGSLFVVPYFESHALIEFDQDKYPTRITEAGIRIGLMYKIK